VLLNSVVASVSINARGSFSRCPKLQPWPQDRVRLRRLGAEEITRRVNESQLYSSPTIHYRSMGSWDCWSRKLCDRIGERLPLRVPERSAQKHLADKSPPASTCICPRSWLAGGPRHRRLAQSAARVGTPTYMHDDISSLTIADEDNGGPEPSRNECTCA
jgi:hypothetical protein